MGAASYAIPVGVLSAIVVASLVFVWWWFPKAYRKGVKADMDRVDQEREMRDRHRAEHGSEATSINGDVEANAGTGEGMPAAPPPAKHPSTFKYTPAAYTAY